MSDLCYNHIRRARTSPKLEDRKMIKIKKTYYFEDKYNSRIYETLHECREEAIKYANSMKDTALGTFSIFIIQKIDVIDEANTILTHTSTQIDHIFIDSEKRVSWTFEVEGFHYLDFYLEEE